jgi:hypothetical protein
MDENTQAKGHQCKLSKQREQREEHISFQRGENRSNIQLRSEKFQTSSVRSPEFKPQSYQKIK